MRRVRGGVPFRRAYREVAAALRRGDPVPPLSATELIAARRSTGSIGNLGLPAVRTRIGAARRWNRRQRGRFDAAIRRLAGRGAL